MEQLINSLPALLRAAGDAPEITEAAALAAWNHIAGDGLRRHAVAQKLSGQKLTVAVADLIWQRQLESMSGQLLFRLNSLLERKVVAFLEFRIDRGAVSDTSQPNPSARLGSQISAERIPFELLSAAASINDPGLRRALLGAALSCARRLER